MTVTIIIILTWLITHTIFYSVSNAGITATSKDFYSVSDAGITATSKERRLIQFRNEHVTKT